MKISVVTLSFNQGRFLEEAMTSVLEQRDALIEYILVDPGSTDGSREVIGGHGECLHSVIFEADQGPADGLNKGFSRATGDVFGFVNADDLLLPGALGLVSAYFQEHSDCDVLMGSGAIVDEHTRLLRRVLARPFSVERFFTGQTRWLQQSTFFRKATYAKVGGFNVHNRTSWDGELFLRMAAAGAGFHCAPELHLGAFRVHEGSLSVRNESARSSPGAQAWDADWRRMFEMVHGRAPEPRDYAKLAALGRLSSLGDWGNAVQGLLGRLRRGFPGQTWMRPAMRRPFAESPRANT